MTQTFPDVSHYQAGLSLKGAAACIAKATQGTGYVDASYAQFKAQAAALGIPFAAYHWVDGTDLAVQAHHAYTVAGPGTVMMWDAEATGATVPRILALTSLYRSLGGTARLVYLPRWWWHDHIGAPDLRPLTAAGLALVSSSYPSAGYSDNGPGWVPYGGVTPTVWQYTDAQPFNGQHVDFNAFKGTPQQLRALLTVGGLNPAQEDDMPKLVRCEDGAVWITNGPHRYHIPDPGAYGHVLALWGLSTADVVSIKTADLPAYGVDATAGGPGAPAVVDLAAIAKAVNDTMATRLAQ